MNRLCANCRFMVATEKKPEGDGVFCARFPPETLVIMVEESPITRALKPVFVNVLRKTLPAPLACGEWQKGLTCVNLPTDYSTPKLVKV